MSHAVSSATISHFRDAFQEILRWDEQIPPAQHALLLAEPAAREWARQSLIESYWRMCETTRLILAAVQALDTRGDIESARFWSAHIDEELGHDRVFYKDVCAQYGSVEAGEAALAKFPPSPATAALLGYFRWQVERGNPHLLMVLRFFLESFLVVELDEMERFERSLGNIGLETLRTHREHDLDHVKPCGPYLDAHFEPSDIPTIVWSSDFITTCLIESQTWVATRVLRNLE
ncbi:MAG: hypothetical protein GY937_15935 [bacterium]|nr:hypothetical protein [bacterium]